MTVTDEMLIAYVDGEADAAVRAAVEAQAAADPEFAERLARHTRTRSRFAGAFAGVLDEPVPQRLIDAVAAGEAKVIDLASRRRGPPVWAIAGMAACLVLGLIAGPLLRPMGPIGPAMNAQGQLALALDSRLASADQTGQAVRIGVSFKAHDGRYCRTFATSGEAGVAGVACRDPKAWHVLATASQPDSQAPFRTAAAAPPAVMTVVEQLISGEPFDAKAEQAARDRGWR